MLISIEGIDGSGKTTLLNKLGKSLADLNPVLTREPGSTWIGEQVRRAIQEHMDPITEALLFAADHAAHLAMIVKPALQQGKLVITDRYIDSRYAYQSVTLDGVITQPLQWLRQIHERWTIRPDRTFLLIIPIPIAIERVTSHKSKEHFEHADILDRVQAQYLDLAAADPKRFVLIDSLKEKEEIHQFVSLEIRTLVESSQKRHRP